MYNSIACSVVDANFATWGSCLTDTVGLGSPTIIAIMLFAVLMYIVYKFNIPTEASIILGVGMVFAMITSVGGIPQEYMQTILAITMLGIATLIVVAALKFAKR